MSVSVEQQLREYFTHVDAVQASVGIGELARSVDPSPPASEPDEEEFMLVRDTDHPEHRAPKTAVWVTAAAVIVLMAGALALAARSGGDDPGPAERPVEESTPTEAEESEFDDAAPDMGFPSEMIGGERVSTHLLGPPVEFELTGTWTILEASASTITLRDETVASDGRYLLLTRVGGWNSADESVDPDLRTTGTIDPADVDRWIEENEIVLGDRREVDVDGRVATVLDVTVDPERVGVDIDFPRDPINDLNDSCTADTSPCIWYRSIPEISDLGRGPRPDPVMHAGQIRRMWVVPIEGHEPILVEAVATPGHERWLDRIETTTVADMTIAPAEPPRSLG